jgi:FKBP-type peptidyl-prolyl cis-trans isomerase FklB
MLAAGLSAALVQVPARAADQRTNQAPGAASQVATFKDDKEKASYAVGMYFGNLIKRNSLDLDVSTVVSTMKDVLDGKTTKLSDQEGQQAIMAYQQQARMKQAEKNKKDGEAFLAANKNKPGVKTKTVTLPDGKTAELQYKILKEGTGVVPKTNDIVSFNYRGTLINGTEFDSSAKHGAPMKQSANQLIRGWTEALRMMPVGSKWELYIPSSLAYADAARPGIEPGSTLIFELELLSAEAPPTPPAPQPLTSDIIKVPSAEELKRGAKIEVLKPEEAARQAQQQAAGKTNTSK